MRMGRIEWNPSVVFARKKFCREYMRLFLSNTYSNPMILLMKYLLCWTKSAEKSAIFVNVPSFLPMKSQFVQRNPWKPFSPFFFSTGAGLRRAPRAPPPSAACQTPRGPGRAGDVRRAPRSRSRSSCEDSPNLQIQTNYLWKVFFGIIIHTHTHIYIYI